ncbi:MAG: sulfite exporter TauE/SafE family protein [Planctomycetes bacterium]|nr:sulfite exporter TauE/SafE family protein [Planctomycetota bacterium]
MTNDIDAALSYRPWVLWLIGIFAGFVSGFFGIGGGVFMVPAMCMLLKYPIKRAISTSLGAIIVFAVGGTILHIIHSQMQIWWIVFFAAIGAIPATILGVRLRNMLPDYSLRVIFGIVMFFASFRILFSDFFSSWQIIPDGQYFWYIGVGIVGGLFSACLGIGGGAIMIPAMYIFGGIPMEIASPTSLATVILISGSGVVFQKKLKTLHLPSMRHLAISGVITVFIGVYLLNFLSVESPEIIKKMFGVLLVLIGLRMMIPDRSNSKNNCKKPVKTG